MNPRPPATPYLAAAPPGGARIEPAAGDWTELDFDAPHRRNREDDDTAADAGLRGWLLRHWLRVALILVGIAALAALTLWRQPLSEWVWPETRLQRLRDQAAQALSEGRLSSPDGRGARELYEAALAVDPDRGDARQGLARTGEVALQQARQAIDGGHFEFARQRIALARDLAVPRAKVEPLAQLLRQREAAHAGLDRMVAAAAGAREQGRLDGAPDAALPLYLRVLELQPQRNDALEGRDDTLADLLQQARQALERGELVRGAQGIARAQEADPGHADLPDSLTLLELRLERRRGEAAQALRRQRLDAAVEAYRDVLTVRPDDAAAREGLMTVAAAHAERSERLAADFRFADAEEELGLARAIAPAAPAMAIARQHLDRARESRKRFDQEGPAHRRQSLQRLLAEAAAAEQRGDLLTPPGDSAYDKLRAAQAIAPNDAAVRAAAARLLPAAKRCFERELGGNRLSRAGECLDARRALEGGGGAVREASARLAQRWIGVGSERLGAGELRAAQAALQAARGLDGNAPGLAELAARVQAAGAASN
ncbi:hypothetical protein [Lysobacter enzymogenes]|uniref:hypothetical protein n=1 Tax=Lysobacter enzymogenes TaxID=69 RepID=UPI00089C205C|nr:hypothetical protein [Lysobacter enzymogenes]SDW31827.1 hypothetical protein SAMN05421681_101698 [Lysobacter enzymogenes]